ncbi:MAG: hypothetical protein AAGI51_15420 [Pseudomonadota bacterium]
MRMSLGAALLCLVLGCTTLSVTGLMQVARLDVMTADAEALRVAVKAPDALNLPPDGAVMTFGARHPDGRSLEERFVLAPALDDRGDDGLAGERAPGFILLAYRVAPEDLPRLEKARAEIAAWKAQAGDDVQGSLAIRAMPCRTGPAPEGPLPVTTFLRIDPEAPYFRLTGPTDLAAMLDEAGAPLREAPGCAAPQAG